MKFSVLDSAPVRVDGTGAEALTESLERAQQLDQIGCHRLWFTEHHLAPDVASTSPLTMVGQVAARTTNLRLGAGGVMIRNHPPLVVAEQAATLSLLYPDRIDLGIGRSGGSDHSTDTRIRRTIMDYNTFDEDVDETIYLLGQLGATEVRVFILASSPETALFAGRRGLGLAVAGHVAPAGIESAITAYRGSYRARQQAEDRPWVVLCLPVLIAQSDADARWWFRSVQRRYLDRLRTGGAPMVLPAEADLDWSASESYRVDRMLEAAIVGSPGTVATKLREMNRRWAPDELMAMTDLPCPKMTMNSHIQLAKLAAALLPGTRATPPLDKTSSMRTADLNRLQPAADISDLCQRATETSNQNADDLASPVNATEWELPP